MLYWARVMVRLTRLTRLTQPFRFFLHRTGTRLPCSGMIGSGSRPGLRAVVGVLVR